MVEVMPNIEGARKVREEIERARRDELGLGDGYTMFLNEDEANQVSNELGCDDSEVQSMTIGSAEPGDKWLVMCWYSVSKLAGTCDADKLSVRGCSAMGSNTCPLTEKSGV